MPTIRRAYPAVDFQSGGKVFRSAARFDVVKIKNACCGAFYTATGPAFAFLCDAPLIFLTKRREYDIQIFALDEL